VNVLMFMFAGSDTSRESHKMLLGILPELPPAVIEKVALSQRCIDPIPLSVLCQCTFLVSPIGFSKQKTYWRQTQCF
jgi:hypothetical protein